MCVLSNSHHSLSNTHLPCSINYFNKINVSAIKSNISIFNAQCILFFFVFFVFFHPTLVYHITHSFILFIPHLTRDLSLHNLFFLSMAESTHLAVFPPEVLARIAPDVSLQRHLALGLRPCLRAFDEFRPLHTAAGSMNNLGENTVVGLATVKNGQTHVFCGITIAISELNQSDELLSGENDRAAYLSVYPVVEIARGRNGAPSDEEMILSQKLYNYVLHLRVLSEKALEFVPGYQIFDEESGISSIAYLDDDSSPLADLLGLSTVNITKKRFKFVLSAHIKVFSRSGPLYDVVHQALMAALQDVSLPRIYLADSGIDANVRIPVRSRGNFGHLNQQSDSFCIDPNPDVITKLALNEPEVAVSTSFGLVDWQSESTDSATVLLADLEGEAEEICAESKLTVVSTGEKLKHVSIVGGGANVTLESLQQAVKIANARAVSIKSS